MPRPATGTVKLIGGRWHARIRVPGGGRPWVELPAGIDEAKARRLAVIQQRLVKENGVLPRTAPAPEGETVAAYLGRWHADRVERGLRSARDDEGRFNAHVAPQLGALPMVKVTREHIEAWVERIDARVRKGELSAKTAQNAWALLRKLFSDACRSKARALRVLAANPCADVAGPDRSPRKAKAYLYPSEATALLACERVPLHWRRIFALATYTYVRAGELEALEWEDVDLPHGVITVHRSADRETGETRTTKTAAGVRTVPIESALRPLLEAMHRESGGVGRVVPHMPSRELGASTLRKALGLAGVTRAALFANDATRKHVTFHDLRSSGITWCAMRGDEPVKLQRRAGHSDFGTTLGYVREAESVRADFGVPFPALPAGLLAGGFGPGKDNAGSGQKTQPRAVTTETVATPTGFETGGRVANGSTPPESRRASRGSSAPFAAFGHAPGPIEGRSFAPRAVALSLRAALALPYHDADAAWLADEGLS